ncbi:MAG: PKD domain-containing protein [Bacteroidales bacterium]|nr:PKD domain-containing protein [Bacteroidales bacterium]MCF6341361.1 PKD domain-containing protein [Bacteroidales bacterium]
MKRKLFAFSILVLTFLLLHPQLLRGDEDWIYFDGFVTDIDNGSPLVEHPVFLSGEDSVLFSMTFTDDAGYYLDSLFVEDSDIENVLVSSFDCNGLEHFYFYEEPESENRYDFELCAGITECQAFYFYEEDEENNLLLYFFDYSEGDIDQWTWYFGDGTSSTEQNPSHLYNAGGVYEVCLIVENTGDSCYSEFCLDVLVGEGDCEAGFEWEPSEENPLEINFTDKSSGNIFFWQWDFGDSTYSDLQSPVHEYAAPGQYMVFLFVSDSGGYCVSQTMEMIQVDMDTTGCEAAFSYTLDTLNNTPFVYLFEDLSEGNINNWFWEFGDNQVSTEKSPQHIYEEGGTYEVCLKISASPNGGGCESELCQTIETPSYFNFGGQVFVDGFTINIDSADKANIAMAYLYRRMNNQWWFMDSREFWKYGYYWFSQKPEGEYLIRTDLLEGSLDYGNYAPAYFEAAVNWTAAKTFFLLNGEEFSVNIELEKLAPLQAGIASLSGYLLEGWTCGSGVQLQHQLIELFNAENKVVAFTYTDEYGNFSFNGLAFDNYRLRAELTGKTVTFVDLSPDAGNPNISEIELIVDCNSFVGVEEYFVENNFVLESVYPLPATDFITLRMVSKISTGANLFIYNLNGQKVFEESYSLGRGKQEFHIPVKALNQGLYLLKLVSVDGKNTISRKILINR